jgi:oligopeptide/dipeptide ABC transporter ATP-binding protein
LTALEIEGLRVRYGEGRTALLAVAGVDLAIRPGETHGLVGESGSGKSTIARAVVGLVPAEAGTIRIGGHALDGKGKDPRHRRVQMVFQNPYGSLNPRLRVADAIAEALLIHRPELAAKDRLREAGEVLAQVGLGGEALERFPHQFSGGQRQRVAIARALATEAPVLVLDEVTSALDVSVQATILNLLRELQRRRRLSYLFISHDLSVVRYMSEVVSVMHLGRIVETAPTADLFAAPRHPYTKALLDALPSLSGRRERRQRLEGEIPDPRRPPAGCRFHTRCPVGPLARPERAVCRELDPPPTAFEARHSVACHFAGT